MFCFVSRQHVFIYVNNRIFLFQKLSFERRRRTIHDTLRANCQGNQYIPRSRLVVLFVSFTHVITISILNKQDLASRDVVSRSITMEIREGRGVGPLKVYRTSMAFYCRQCASMCIIICIIHFLCVLFLGPRVVRSFSFVAWFVACFARLCIVLSRLCAVNSIMNDV